MRQNKRTRRSEGATLPSSQDAGEPCLVDAWADASRVWLPDIVEHIAYFLLQNEVACTLRLVCRATAQQFAGRAIVRPAQPVPRWCFASECRRVCRGLTCQQRLQLLSQTAASGDVVNLEAALAEAGLPLSVEALEAAAEAGQLVMCQWLVGPGRIAWDITAAKRAGEAAAAGGHGPVVDWCLQPRGAEVNPGSDCVEAAVMAALHKGHKELAWRLVEAHPGPGLSWSDALCSAAEGCSLAGLQRVFARYTGSGGRPTDPGASRAVARAICSKTSDWEDKFDFLLEQGFFVPQRLCYDVARSLSGEDAVEGLAWLQAGGVALTADALEVAARRGDAVLVAYLLEQGLEPRTHDMLMAALAGSAATLQALVAAAGPGTLSLEWMARHAAKAGSVAALSWLVETYGAEAIGSLSPELFRTASQSGNVELMAWLLARGCGVCELAWDRAAMSGCEAALELLAERGCPKPLNGWPYWSAAFDGDVRTMAVLKRLGISFGAKGGEEMFESLVTNVVKPACTLRALAWLLANGCKVDWVQAERSASQGRPAEEVLAWLAEHKPQPRRAGLRPRRGQ